MAASVVIPAYRAAATVAETVRGARQIHGVGEIIVVDDGSGDGTGEAARSAGADRIILLPANRGKGAALSAGIAAASGEALLFLDADLGASAAEAGPLLSELSAIGSPGMTVAALPARPGGGGFGLAMGLARITIRLLSGLCPAAPMSGQRAVTADMVRHIGIAPRFGVEVGLTVEAAHVGAPMREVNLPLDHARTGRTLSGFAHRARQFGDVLRFLVATGYGIGWPAQPAGEAALRATLLVLALAAVTALGNVVSPALSATTGIACAAALALWLPTLWLTSVALGLRKPNYLGRRLPSGAGLLFPVVGLLGVVASGLDPREKWAALTALGGFGALGLVDDLFAAGHQARGLRGHLRALLRGRATTGAIKAIGGIIAGVVVGVLLDGGTPWLAAVDALLVALSANSVNLLDLRPGRALKGFLLLTLVAASAAPDTLRLLCPVVAAAIVSAPSDLAGRAMMGDVGANVLGAAAGLGLVLALPPWARIGAVAVLIVFHIVCERQSLTEIIERNWLLRYLDQLGTRHLAPLPVPGGEQAR